MIAHEMNLYEQKILNDREFPVQVFMNRPQGRCCYFGMHWQQEAGWKLACKGALLSLVCYLARHYAQEKLTDRESIRRRKNLERLNTVLRYIEANYPNNINNSELAELVHLSNDRFSHLFRESVGMAPLQYINEVRLKKAMNLLKNGGYTAVQVADAVGFSDYNNFGRMFKRYYGCTPLEARKGK